MLLIHWSKQNNTSDIIKNGIKSIRRKNKDYDETEIKGVWCFPYSRNKTLNTTWKSNLKSWRKIDANFNGFVFKLEEKDFPIYAGDWFYIALNPENHKFNTYSDFIKKYGKYFSETKIMNNETTSETIDFYNFEIIIPNKINPRRIVKIIKDRPNKNLN